MIRAMGIAYVMSGYFRGAKSNASTYIQITSSSGLSNAVTAVIKEVSLAKHLENRTKTITIIEVMRTGKNTILEESPSSH